MNWIAFDELTQPIKANVKIRFRASEQPATISPNGDGTVTIIFDEPQRSITPGQSAVIYEGNTVLGGGRIIKSLA